MRKQKIYELLSRIPNEIKEMELEIKEIAIYDKLLSIADDDGWCYVTVNCLANELNYEKSTVLVFTKTLENKKLITQRIIGNRYTRTRFKLNLFLPNTYSSSNNTTESNTKCVNSSIEDPIDIKVNDLMNEIEDVKFELKMTVSLKNNKTSSKQVSEFKDKKIVFDIVNVN